MALRVKTQENSTIAKIGQNPSPMGQVNAITYFKGIGFEVRLCEALINSPCICFIKLRSVVAFLSTVQFVFVFDLCVNSELNRKIWLVVFLQPSSPVARLYMFVHTFCTQLTLVFLEKKHENICF